MEERIQYLTGRPHVALDGRLMSMPVIEIAAGRCAMLKVSALLSLLESHLKILRGAQTSPFRPIRS